MEENKKTNKRITKLIRISADNYEILRIVSKSDKVPMSRLVDFCVNQEIIMAKKSACK